MLSSGPGPIHRLVWLENYPEQCWRRTIPLKRDGHLQSVSKRHHQVRILKKQRILVVLDSRRRRIRDGEQTIPASLLLLLLLLTLLLLLMLHVP